ncbi:hypothetical protein LTR37_009932 [Vermiconidia calcicola]|uniref:Uncharacterized protein n=1 Tax=Vermiconidia calcicola TaxID=1690605 RepID=A0ACC3N691_9PEZI|nr:hypothetical protein LTR37_009932 [Vermiconidia calcicola]
MKLVQLSVILAGYITAPAFAAPTGGAQGIKGNPLATLPELPMGAFAGDVSFLNADVDGVYRAYLDNGTVAAAARMDAVQIETWLSARANSGQLSEAQVANERASFAFANSSAVPDEQLLNPPESVKPAGNFEDTTPLDLAPLGKRQLPVDCPISGRYCMPVQRFHLRGPRGTRGLLKWLGTTDCDNV